MSRALGSTPSTEQSQVWWYTPITSELGGCKPKVFTFVMKTTKGIVPMSLKGEKEASRAAKSQDKWNRLS